MMPGSIPDTPFNLSQLATWEQARDLAKKLGAAPYNVGGGVMPETGDPATSGIYTELWLSGPGNFPEPHYFDEKTGQHYYPLLFRFRNGAGGMNVGLIMDKFRRYPSSPAYVFSTLVAEANSMAQPN